MRVYRRISMRVLLARVSILSVCVLAVSAAPARGQSPTLTSVPSEAFLRSRPGTLRRKLPTRLAAQPNWNRCRPRSIDWKCA